MGPKTTTTVSVLAAAAGACAFGQMPAAAASRPSPADVRFMKTLAQGGIAEVKTGKLALTKTRSTDVHNVATTIVQDHTQANAGLMQIAKRQGVALPSDTDPKHKAIYAKLSGMSGTAFDKMYIGGQVKDHDKTVALIKHEQEITQDQPLKTFLAETLPKINMHTLDLHQINGRLAAGNDTKQGGLKNGTTPVGGIKPAGM